MEFKVFDLGLIDFSDAWQFQKQVFIKVKTAILESSLIFCRHYPVITLGRLADKKNIFASKQELEAKGIKVYAIERGGDVTYHGPGQQIVYPIFNLNYLKKDIHWFLRQLEGLVIDCLSDFGVNGQRHDGLTGVWLEDKKIASIGIAVTNWITFHGISINVKKNDLDNFCFIRPCGMDIKVTSLEDLSGKDIEINDIKDGLLHKFRGGFYG